MLAEWRDMVKRHEAFFAPKLHLAPTRSHHHGMGPDVEAWRPLVAEYFTPADVDHALCIMRAESGGDPDAKSTRSSAAGLFQFLTKTWDSVPLEITGGTYSSGAPYDPRAATAAAAWLAYNVSWDQWTTNWRC